MHSLKNMLFNWKHISGFRKRNITHDTEKFVLTEYNIQASTKLKNKTIVFFSDTHFRELQFPYPELADFINSLKPDWIIFGGDLVRYMSYCEDAVEFLNQLTAKTAKLSVLGNNEIRKTKWTSNGFWNKFYKKSGFQLITDTQCDTPPIRFIGINPCTETAILSPVSSEYYTCLISHYPNAVIDMFNRENFKHIDLILCGHTHGGQVRLPFLGAIITGNHYWKLLEYGHYKNRKTQTNMIITNGIGCSGIKYRLCCKPEIVHISFVPKAK